MHIFMGTFILSNCIGIVNRKLKVIGKREKRYYISFKKGLSSHHFFYLFFFGGKGVAHTGIHKRYEYKKKKV